MRLSPLATLVALVALAGCSHGRLVRDAPDGGPVAGYPDHTVPQIVAAVAASAGAVTSAAADGPVTLTQGGRTESATFSLRARFAGSATDSVTVVVRGPLGIEGARAVVSADSILAADRINDVLYIGPVEAVERYVPGAGSPAALARAALGLLVPDAGLVWTVAAADARYVLRAPLPDGTTRELTVDPALWRVVRLRDLAPDGEVLGEQEATDFDRVGGVVAPRRVHLRGGGLEAVLEHRNLDLAPADLRLRFRRPDGYEVVPLP